MADKDNRWNDDDDFDSEDGDFGIEQGPDTPNAKTSTEQVEQEAKPAGSGGQG